jgi:hypothetical protein
MPRSWPQTFLRRVRCGPSGCQVAKTLGKPSGWQSDADWEAGIATQVAAGVVKPGLKTDHYYDNDIIAWPPASK